MVDDRDPLAKAAWRKSSRSDGQNNCVEIAVAGNVVGIRDSKNRDGGIVRLPVEVFGAFIEDVRAGEFDW